MAVAGGEDGPSLADSVMRAAFVEAPVGVAVVGADGTYLTANRAFCELVGRPLDDIVGADRLSTIHPDDRALNRAWDRKLTHGGTDSYEVEERVLRPDGGLRWVHSRVKLERAVDGRPLRWVAVVIDITEQRQAAASLEAKDSVLTEVQERHRLSFEHAPIGQALVGLDGRWLAVNPALTRLLGYTPEEMEQTTFRDLTHPDDVAADDALIERLLAGEADGSSREKRYLRSDGTWVWASRSASLVRDEDGTPLYFITQIEDITERRVHEDELRDLSVELRWANDALQQTTTEALAGAARYRALVDHLPETVAFLIDRQHRITVASGSGPTHFGVEEEALIGKRPEDLLGLQEAAAVHRMVDAAFAGRPTSAELRLTSTGRDELVDVVAIVDDASVEPREVLLLARDISDRKERERALVEHSADLTTITDAAGLVQYASPAWEALTGRRLADAIGTPQCSVIHPDDVEQVEAKMAWLVERPGAMTSYVTRIRRPDNTIRHVEVIATNRLDNPAVGGIVKNARDVTERVEAVERLAHQALHDPLTDLPNRLLLLDRLQQGLDRARRDGRYCAVLFVDLDRFKGINDSLGHATGDRVLVAVAGRLSRALRPEDSVGRLGGDEFVVIVEGLSSPAIVFDLAERLRATVGEPIDLGDQTVTVGCSVGIAVSDRHRPEALIQEADIALYRAKEAGRNRTVLYDEGMHARAVHLLRTEQLIRGALDDGVRVLYQPVIDLRTGGLAGVEALARIDLGDGRLLGAGEFIPAAEENGLIVPLGAAVLEQACAQHARWRAEGGGPAELSVNLSARQLVSAGIVDQVADALQRHGIEPWRLCLELTETALIDAGPSMRRNLDALKALGVSLALDDFGTGWSSLAYLRRFPIDVIKVDRSFVRGLGVDDGDTEVVRAVIGLGHALALRVIAEGVERPGQERLLVELGCDMAQGFRYAKPLEAADIAGFRAPEPVGTVPPTPPWEVQGPRRLRRAE